MVSTLIIGIVLPAVMCCTVIINGWNPRMKFKDTASLTEVVRNTKTSYHKQDLTSLVKTVRNTNKPRLILRYHNFVICSSFWEQQTNALYNMWSFQKWANITGFRTLEPLVQGSNLEFTRSILYNYNFTKSFRFGDYFDLDFWNNMTKKHHGIPPLESWSTYALSKSRQTVVVILLYHVSPQGVYIDNDIDKHPNCVGMKKKFYSRHAFFFSKLHIEAVKNVCFVFGAHFTLSLQ